jgi:predicted CXXCH cytochrome family protein
MMAGRKFGHDSQAGLECTICHSGHGTANDSNLIYKQPVLCLNCHKSVAENWEDGVAHQPASRDCTTCHVPHGSKIKGMLLMKVKKLCLECHVINKDFTDKHLSIKPSAGSCLGCHDPHGAIDKALLYPVAHAPFKEGKCTPCHTGRKSK